MTRSRGAAFLGLVIVPLVGCYETTFPIGRPEDTPRDPRLLGRWRCVSGYDEAATLVTIRPFEDRQYSITSATPDQNESRAYVSSLKGTTVLNVEEIKEGTPKASWDFVRYRLPTPGSLLLEGADPFQLEDLEQTPEAIGAALEGPKADELFITMLVCARVVDEPKVSPSPAEPPSPAPIS